MICMYSVYMHVFMWAYVNEHVHAYAVMDMNHLLFTFIFLLYNCIYLSPLSPPLHSILYFINNEIFLLLLLLLRFLQTN